MIVYADRQTTVPTVPRLAEISTMFDLVERLIAFGEWEAGVVDAICPERDTITPLIRQMRLASMQRGNCNLETLRAFDLPETIEIRVAEGYAFYGLYPEQYAEAAREFHSSLSPHACWVIGIRGIGTSLSGIVAAELRDADWAVESFTVRPHGHPFDRFVSLAPELEDRLRNDRSAWFAIVDEGPGLSGSSFMSVAAKLSELGISDDQVVLFPSWEADPAAFRSAAARERWPRHRKFVGQFRAEEVVPPDASDISAGKWREILYSDRSKAPATQPQHERRKYLAGDRLWKFAGLGKYGKAKRERGRCLARAGFIPPVLGLENGFLMTEFNPGIPLDYSDVDDCLLDRIAEYLSFLKRWFPVPGRVPYAALVEMIRVNTGRECPVHDPLIESGELVALDGRMLPHEWIRTSSGLLKTDALDHHDDHFFPGCQDIVWDIAGAAIEFRMQPEHIDRLLAAYLALESDPTLRDRLSFYRLAYASYRFGYATMAQATLGNCEDRRRFHELALYYAMVLSATDVPTTSSS